MADLEGDATGAPPPQKKKKKKPQFFFYPFNIRMFKNKVQIASKTLELAGPLSGPWTPAVRDFGFCARNVMCARAHNLVPPPPPRSWSTLLTGAWRRWRWTRRDPWWVRPGRGRWVWWSAPCPRWFFSSPLQTPLGQTLSQPKTNVKFITDNIIICVTWNRETRDLSTLKEDGKGIIIQNVNHNACRRIMD